MQTNGRTFTAIDAKREQVPLLVGLVGASGSGKTWSAMRLATGIQKVTGGSIYVIDTEARRALHYADNFQFKHLDFQPPFGSLDYLGAMQFCVNAGAKVIIVDSSSHEHDGPGGMLDFQDRELDRMAGEDFQKRERCKMLAWVKPKAARRHLINGLLQLNANFIFCFRAKSISKPVKGNNGKTEVVPQGFVPIAGDEFVYEMTLNCLLLPKSGGVPTWVSNQPGEQMAMKLPEQFKSVFADRQPLSEDIGRRLAEWAKGGAAVPATPASPAIQARTDAERIVVEAYKDASDGGFIDKEIYASILSAEFSVDERKKLTTPQLVTLAGKIRDLMTGGPEPEPTQGELYDDGHGDAFVPEAMQERK